MSIFLLAIELAVALIFQQEAPYLREWIEYHKLMGVEHFYLYNNLSQDGYLEVLKPYLESGLVELEEWRGEGLMWREIQNSAYKDAMGRACRDQVKWLALIDADEFMVPRTKSLLEWLSDYESDTIGSVSIPWVCFGTSSVDKIPEDKLMIETLLLSGGYQITMYKSIVRPDRVNLERGGNAHYQVLHNPFESRVASFDEIQCNHYWTRDEEFFHQVKIPRKSELGLSFKDALKLNRRFNQTKDSTEPILRFVPLLREKIFGDASLVAPIGLR